MTTIPQIVTDSSITVVVGGKSYTAKKASHPNFDTIRNYLKSGGSDGAKLVSMFDIPQAIATKTNGKVTVSQNGVFYDGKPLHNSLANRMVQMMGEGFNIDPLVNFLTKLMENPSKRAVDGLYDFLAATNIPITPDGDFLAYKKVRSTYFDIHSNTMRNAPGDVLRVKRNQVDEDPDRTCSHGLHVCSESYLNHFGSSGSGDRVVIVQVNPADVVAIPRDYNNAKMRCAGYTVVGEIAPETARNAFTSVVMTGDAFANAAKAAADATTLAYEETDVIRNVNGVLVRFFKEDGEWAAEWKFRDGSDAYDSFPHAKNINEAVADFVNAYMESVCKWTTTARWIDGAGNFRSKTFTFTWADDSTPSEDDIFDTEEYENDDEIPGSEIDVRFVNIKEVPNSTFVRLID